MKNIDWIKAALGLVLLVAAAGVPALSAQGQGNWNYYLPYLNKPCVPTPTPASTDLLCRFGITTLMNMPGYLDLNVLSQLRVGSLMDWDMTRSSSIGCYRHRSKI
jgi:hypothetical protein